LNSRRSRFESKVAIVKVHFSNTAAAAAAATAGTPGARSCRGEIHSRARLFTNASLLLGPGVTRKSERRKVNIAIVLCVLRKACCWLFAKMSRGLQYMVEGGSLLVRYVVFLVLTKLLRHRTIQDGLRREPPCRLVTKLQYFCSSPSGSMTSCFRTPHFSYCMRAIRP
jgi:hypothetical protein